MEIEVVYIKQEQVIEEDEDVGIKEEPNLCLDSSIIPLQNDDRFANCKEAHIIGKTENVANVGNDFVITEGTDSVAIKEEPNVCLDSPMIPLQNDDRFANCNRTHTIGKTENVGNNFVITEGTDSVAIETVKEETQNLEMGVCYPVTNINSVANQSELIKTSGTNLKAHKCTQCEKIFRYRGDLTRHLLIHSGVKPHHCEHCNRDFNHASNLKTHMLIHTGIRPHQCQQCQKEFTHASFLRVHLLSHSGVKDYQCHYCQKAFTLAKTLKTHLLIHTGIKPHQCLHCQKSFLHASTLKTHSLLHSGVKPHQCIHCKKEYTHATSLKTHLLTHSGVKPHQCQLCQKEFKHATTFKTHMLFHSGVKIHQCQHCEKEFTHVRYLKSHLLKNHSDV